MKDEHHHLLKLRQTAKFVEKTPIALTIAGSDSGGGAGIQADLKTFSALGVYGASVLTALTAQNTQEVRAIFNVNPDFIAQQLSCVFDDLSVSAIKIGMLSQTDVIDVIADFLQSHVSVPVVLDPVMVAKSGDRLLQTEAIDRLRQRLLPLATLITPNLPEAATLLGMKEAGSKNEMLDSAKKLRELGTRSVLLTGGHLSSEHESVDLLLTEDEVIWLPAERVHTRNTHGTGCTLSSAITAGLAQSKPLQLAVKSAKTYISAAITAADDLRVGSGHGPVHHFYNWW